MPKFKVITSPPQEPKPDLSAIYRKDFFRKIEQLIGSATPENVFDRQLVKQFVYLGVKGLPIIYQDALQSGFGRVVPKLETLQEYFNLSSLVDAAIAYLTPREMTTIFPITKEYDGERFGIKDYYFTIKELEKMGMDTPIRDSRVSELLWDYYNRHIIEYNVKKLCVMSDMRRYDGHKGIAEEFMEQCGVTTYKLMTDDDGKQFMYDPDKQTTYPVSKPRPRYLRPL